MSFYIQKIYKNIIKYVLMRQFLSYMHANIIINDKNNKYGFNKYD